MRYVVTAEQMRALDRATIEDLGIPGAVLMETAGRAVVERVLELVPRGGRVAVCCGLGNNGGDGYVVARVLGEHGVDATVFLAGDSARVSGDAATHLVAFRRCGGRLVAVDTEDRLREHAQTIECADVVVDAVFGTGLARSVSGLFAQFIEVINRSAGFRVAVDIPSGLSADTGQVLGTAVRADTTVTFAFEKPGLITGVGVGWAGHVTVAEIGIPAARAAELPVTVVVPERTDARALLPGLDPADHKVRRGHVLAVAGSPGKRGAGRMTAVAALRAGAGLVTLAGPDLDPGAHDAVMTACVISPDSLDAAAAGKHAIAIGPGMEPGPAGAALVRRALAGSAPLVIDADGLNHLAGDLAAVADASAPCVLTPHPGEAGRLRGLSTAEVEADRLAAARRLADATGAVVVLKGAGTLVCDPDGLVTVNPTGGPALATAGSGDVLTGLVAGLLAQGMAPSSAARLGVFVHGAAGDRCDRDLGPAGTIATDVIDAIPATLRDLALAA